MSKESIIVGLMGDVMIGRTVDKVLTQKGCAWAWGNMLPMLQQTDFNLANLETALTRCEEKVWKTFNFKASPDKVEALKLANIRVVNLANNHVLDFTEAGLQETIDTLNDAGILHTGAGSNEEDAARAVVMDVNDVSIGIIGYTDNERDWKAAKQKAGVNFIEVMDATDRKKVLEQVKTLKESVEVLILSLHWGPNMRAHPPKSFIRFARELVDAGVDVIHGHSAHNFQGMEVYRGKLICYDTGDFIDDYVVDTELRNDHSFFFRLQFSKQQLERVEIVPVLISDYRVNLATGDDYRWSIERMQALSGPFKTTISNDGIVDLQHATSKPIYLT